MAPWGEESGWHFWAGLLTQAAGQARRPWGTPPWHRLGKPVTWGSGSGGRGPHIWDCLLPPQEGLVGSPLGGCSPPADPLLPSPSSAKYAQQTHPTHSTSSSQVVPSNFEACFAVCRHVCARAHTHTHGVHTPLLYPLSKYLSLFVPLLPFVSACVHSPTCTCLIYEHHTPLPPLTDIHAIAVLSR